MRHTRRGMENTLAIILCTAVTADILKREKRWLKHENLLSEEEKQIIRHLDTLINRVYSPIIHIVYGNEKKEKVPQQDRLTLAFNKLVW